MLRSACACLATLAAIAASPASKAPAGPAGAVLRAAAAPRHRRPTISNGRACGPGGAPPAGSSALIAAANQIVEKPYRYGGGHRPPTAAGSSTRAMTARARSSHALFGGRFLRSPLPFRVADELGPEAVPAAG